MNWWRIALYVIPTDMYDEVIELKNVHEGKRIILDIEKKWDGRIKIRPTKDRPTQSWVWDGIDLNRVR